MTDLSTLLGATATYDPTAAKGYLSDLGQEQKKTQTEYDDAVAERRARLKTMEGIVDQTTRALLEARANRINLPLLAAGSAMMMPSRTGGLGESLGAAGQAALPYLQAGRASDDAHTMQVANLKTLPLTMGDTISKDVAGQLATRINAQEGQRGAVTRGMLSGQNQANIRGMQLSVNDLNAMRKQAAQEAKNEMAASLRSGAVYEGDEAEIERQITEAKYAQLFYQKYGKWPSQVTQGRENMSPTELEQTVPKMPRRIEKESKDDLARIGAVRDAGAGASASYAQLNALDYGNTPQGVFAPIIEEFGRWASSLGLQNMAPGLIAQSANITEFKKVMMQSLLEIQKAQKGVQTEGDAKRMSQAIQSITNAKEANDLIRKFLQSQNLTAMFAQDVANDFVAKQKNRASGIDKFVNENARMPLTHMVGSKMITLNDAYNTYRARNPNASPDEALRATVDLWKKATGG